MCLINWKVMFFLWGALNWYDHCFVASFSALIQRKSKHSICWRILLRYKGIASWWGAKRTKRKKYIQETIHETQLLFKSILELFFRPSPVVKKNFNIKRVNSFINMRKTCLIASFRTLKNAWNCGGGGSGCHCSTQQPWKAAFHRLRSVNIPGTSSKNCFHKQGWKAIKTYRKCKIHVAHKSAKTKFGRGRLR